MLINDLVILGRACPEPLKDGRVTVCMAGWSDKLGFVRIYPTRTDMKWSRWDVVKLEVERNDRDTRLESWKIVGSKTGWEDLSDKVEKVGTVKSGSTRRNLIGNLTDTCVNVLNDEKRSLGIIKPDEILDTYFADNDDYGNLYQLGLPGLTELDAIQVKRDFKYEPRIKYRCPNCQTQRKYHDQQILEWGFYEWFRKSPDNINQVWQNTGFNNPKQDIYLFVGNQAAHRTSFMVISVLRVPAGSVEIPMFPYKKLAPPDIN